MSDAAGELADRLPFFAPGAAPPRVRLTAVTSWTVPTILSGRPVSRIAQDLAHVVDDDLVAVRLDGAMFDVIGDALGDDRRIASRIMA